MMKIKKFKMEFASMLNKYSKFSGKRFFSVISSNSIGMEIYFYNILMFQSGTGFLEIEIIF